MQGQAKIPNLGPAGVLDFPQSSLVYFQFVFAAITPILMLGSVLGRVNFKAWIPFVVLWSTCVYTVNAFLIWGGGWFAQQGAVDFSGGYVIHLAAGVSGFVAAWVIGPRLARDREIDAPNNLAMVALGAGLLWLGWNGFNGGDPYNAGADAASAVLNTNLATAVAFLVWVGCDYATKRKPSLIGSVNGMIVGLVAITPGGRLRERLGRDRDRRDRLGRSCTSPTTTWRCVRPFRSVDDTLGVVYTHGFAGLIGGLLTGLLADSAMQVVPGISVIGRAAPAQVAGAHRALGDRLLGGRHVHPAQAGRARHPAADERGGHGDGRHRRPRSRGLPVRHPVARVPVRSPGGRPGRRRGPSAGRVDGAPRRGIAGSPVLRPRDPRHAKERCANRTPIDPGPPRSRENPMATKIIVSYDGTENDRDALALGRLLAEAGASLELAYVRHAQEAESGRERLAEQRGRKPCSRRAPSVLGERRPPAPRRR